MNSKRNGTLPAVRLADAPARHRRPLTQAQVDLIAAWIDAGAMND